MYEDSCPHGYIAGSCAECRTATDIAAVPDTVRERFDRYVEQHRGGSRESWNVRRAEAVTEAAKLASYARRSRAQDDQLEEAHAEIGALDTLIVDDDVRVRSESISRGMQLMADPANCEESVPGTRAAGGREGSPALIGDRNRAESAAETLQRMRSNPWRHEDGPVNRVDTTAGLIARAYTVLEGLEPQLTRDGAQKLAEQLLADSYGWPLG
jgi:hypothetical protein